MFDDRLVGATVAAQSGQQNGMDGDIETRMREAVEKVTAKFRMLELKYGAGLDKILEFLEKHGYKAKELFFGIQDKMDSDIYGRLLANTISQEEVDGWFSALVQWEKTACELAEHYEKIMHQQTECVLTQA